jgi:hypothetical protein
LVAHRAALLCWVALLDTVRQFVLVFWYADADMRPASFIPLSLIPSYSTFPLAHFTHAHNSGDTDCYVCTQVLLVQQRRVHQDGPGAGGELDNGARHILDMRSQLIQSFLSVVGRRCCSFSNGEYVRTGLAQVASWIMEHGTFWT